LENTVEFFLGLALSFREVDHREEERLYARSCGVGRGWLLKGLRESVDVSIIKSADYNVVPANTIPATSLITSLLLMSVTSPKSWSAIVVNEDLAVPDT